MKRHSTAVPILALAVLAGGCATAYLPPKLSDAQAEAVETVRFPARVAVEEFDHPVYSERLVGALQATGLFDEVGAVGEIEDPDLIASVDRPIYGTASLFPLLTIVSLGVIPSTVSEEWGEAFSLRAAESPGRPVAIEFSYEGPSTLGWFSLLRAPFPRHTLRNPRGTGRFHDALAYAIVEQADAIHDLLEGRDSR